MHESVPTIGLTSLDQRQPGSIVALEIETVPTFVVCTVPCSNVRVSPPLRLETSATAVLLSPRGNSRKAPDSTSPCQVYPPATAPHVSCRLSAPRRSAPQRLIRCSPGSLRQESKPGPPSATSFPQTPSAVSSRSA